MLEGRLVRQLAEVRCEREELVVAERSGSRSGSPPGITLAITLGTVVRTIAAMTHTPVRLDPMSDAEYAVFLPMAVVRYAASNVSAGNWAAEEAEKRSEAVHGQLLPGGLATRGAHLYVVRDAATEQEVGMLWIALRDKGAKATEAYVYSIEVYEGSRGRGYGRATMLAGADRARKLGASTYGLHVFAHNAVARRLYDSLGFQATGIMMSLEL